MKKSKLSPTSFALVMVLFVGVLLRSNNIRREQMKKLIIASMAIFLTAGAAWAQERPQADVQVRSVSVTRSPSKAGKPQLVCEVVVYSYHDDDAGNATMRILLPVGVHVISLSAGCKSSTTIPFDGSQGFVTCNLGDIAVGVSKNVRVVTTLPIYPDVHNTFGAFVWSNTPDPDPHNNYGEGTAR